jgi:hypothetical protein
LWDNTIFTYLVTWTSNQHSRLYKDIGLVVFSKLSTCFGQAWLLSEVSIGGMIMTQAKRVGDWLNTIVSPHKRGPDSSVSIATGYGVDGPGIKFRWGARFSAPVQTGPGAHPSSCTIDTGSFPGVKSGRGVTLTLNLLLVPWSRKGRAIPLLHLWAVRPVQSLSACTRVQFSFTLPP